MTGVYVKGEGICIQRDRAEGHVKTQTETGVTLPRATEYLRPPAAGPGKGGFFSRGIKESMGLLELDFRPQASRTAREQISHFELQNTSL